MLNRFVRLFGGDPNKREIERYAQIVEQINGLEKPYEQMSNETLHAKTGEFRLRLAQGASATVDGAGDDNSPPLRYGCHCGWYQV